MFCGNCGNSNPEGAPYCVTCGAPLQQAPQQPQNALQNLMADKKKLFTVIGIAVAAVVVVILLIALLSGGHGYGSPEDAALAYVEGRYEGDWGQYSSAIHPAVLEDEGEDDMEADFEDWWEEYEEEMDDEDISLDEVNARSAKKVENYTKKSIKKYYDEKYDLKVTNVKTVRVVIKWDVDGDTEKDERTVTVVEIDGDWYVNG